MPYLYRNPPHELWILSSCSCSVLVALATTTTYAVRKHCVKSLVCPLKHELDCMHRGKVPLMGRILTRWPGNSDWFKLLVVLQPSLKVTQMIQQWIEHAGSDFLQFTQTCQFFMFIHVICPAYFSFYHIITHISPTSTFTQIPRLNHHEN